MLRDYMFLVIETKPTVQRLMELRMSSLVVALKVAFEGRWASCSIG